MDSSELLPTVNVVDPGDVELFDAGVEAGLITLCRGARFNTADRPTAGGRWGLLSRTRRGGWYNAEYLPQVAAYVEAILHRGYPSGRVLFELPARALQLDLAILDDASRVLVVGEAKRSAPALAVLRERVLERFADAPPDAYTKNAATKYGNWPGGCGPPSRASRGSSARVTGKRSRPRPTR